MERTEQFQSFEQQREQRSQEYDWTQQMTENLKKLSVTSLPYPEEIVKVTNAIQSNSDTPGEIKIGPEGKLLQEFLRFEGLTKQIIHAYDNWIEKILPQRIVTTVINFSLGTIRFSDVSIMKPSYEKTETKTLEKMYPHKARRDKLSYNVSVYVKIQFFPKRSDSDATDNAEPEQEVKCKIGEIPVMLGSKYCNLYGLSEKQLLAVGECVLDPYAYFIIEGAEKIVLQHDKLRVNKPLIFPKENKSKNKEFGIFEEKINTNTKGPDFYHDICKFTAMPSLDSERYQEEKKYPPVNNYDAKKSTVVNLYCENKTKSLMVKLDRFSNEKYLNIFYLYELYGVNADNAIKMILNYSSQNFHSNIRILLFHSITIYNQNKDLISVLKEVMPINDYDVDKMNTNEQMEIYQERIGEVFFKQVEGLYYPTKERKYRSKLEMLSIMASRYCEHLLRIGGGKGADDRDSWANKRVVSAGPAIEHLFNQIWGYLIIEHFYNYLNKITINEQSFNLNTVVPRLIPANFIKETFEKSFNPNSWGVQQSIVKENMTDFLKNETLLAKYSQILRVSPETSDKGKQAAIREVNFTQLGYICSVETPEGKQCGIVKALAVGCYISIGRDESEIFNFVKSKISVTSTVAFSTAFVLNGKFIGWCNGSELENKLKLARRTQKIYRDTMIYLEEPRVLWVYCDSGRPTRPLLVVDQETGRLLIDIKDMWNASFSELLNEGVVEYIDALEQEKKCLVAQNIWDPVFQLNDLTRSASALSKSLSNPTAQRDPYAFQSFSEIVRPQKYTHCEMDPNSILSLVASIIPMPDRSQAPRNTYQTSMGKQALSIQNTNAINRFDVEVKSLAYPSRTIFETQMYKYIGMDELPIGETVMVAIMPYMGYNQEDAIIMNQASIDLGLFRIVRTLTYKTIADSDKDFNEIIQKPLKKVKNADLLDSDGVILPGSMVQQDDCLIGKVKKVYSTGELVDASIYCGIGDSGIVERVLKTVSSDSRRVVLVKIREVRKPRAGDKFASRYAQKGTIGVVLPKEDMPFITDGPNAGAQPDLIINPHCFTGDSLIGLTNGLSRKISSFSSEGCEMVWTIGEKGLVQRHSLGMESKGVKDIVQVTLMDGRKLRCTPDHKFVTFVDGQRVDVEAGKLTGKEVVMGMECVEDKVGQDEIGWKLKTSEYTFKMDTLLNREKTLAFARILGFVLTDGCVHKDKRDDVSYSCPVYIGTKMDLENILMDVKLICGKIPKSRKYDNGKGSVYIINLPSSISKTIGNLEGMTIGRRSTQEAKWPEFLLESDCPISFLREFVAGLFGGDGHCPMMMKDKVSPIYFSNTVCVEHIQTLKSKMSQLCDMIQKIGVQAKVSRIRKAHQKTEEYRERPRLQCEIVIRDVLGFSEKIGFRYCVQKLSKLSVTVGYLRLQQNVQNQMNAIQKRVDEIFETNKGKLTLNECLEQSRREFLEKEFPLNEYYSLSNIQAIGNRRRKARSSTLKSFDYTFFPTFSKYLEQVGCLEWFNKSKKYINNQDDDFISTYHMKVVDVRPCGQEQVYDIGVSEFHYFTTQSVCVSNCIPSRMTVGKMIEILSSKVAGLKGEKVNATAFRPFDIHSYFDALGTYGFDRFGTENMSDGMEGTEFSMPIFTGPCYYQALKHHVQDKIQQRGRGAIKSTTRQPTTGKSKGGGIRVGEMERDAILGHGATHCLREKTFDHSDPFKTLFCVSCGTISSVKTTNLGSNCAKCDQAKYGLVSIPYSYKVLLHELGAANITINFKLAKKKKE
jgi:DNA-directed RNA polymerase II subunit RPB2